jgi:hypothetical protein
VTSKTSTVIYFPKRTFVEWVEQVRGWYPQQKHKRLSDDLIFDLKRDDTLPPTFFCLADFRAYLRSQNACLVALQSATLVWRRYQRWLGRARS